MHDAYESLEQLIARGYCVNSAAVKISADGSDYKRLVEYGKEFLGDPEAEHYEARPPTGRTSIIYKGEIYDSATDVAREFGVARSTVYRWVKDGMAVIVKSEPEVRSTITSKRIKELRKRAGMSQWELSKAIGASKNGVWLWERGTKPNRKSIAMICQHFNVTEDWLLGKEGRMALKEAYAAYITDLAKRQAIMDELDEDGYMPMSCQWEDILKAMKDRDKKEAQK